ncbi:MAG TPA: DinB family protein [Gemmatimonadales bacterium]|nr:DinB family protein [Gemmatimonadales bacterium]
MSGIEAWLDGPVEGIPPLLMPVAHALIQTCRDLESAAADLTGDELWARPGGAAAVGFHLRHIAGSTDRLVTYARGVPLTPDQVRAIKLEGTPGEPPAPAKELLASVASAVDAALAVLRETPAEQLLEFRGVGKAQRPSDVIGLLSHAAQHAQRHAGQVITTIKIIRGLGR